MKLLDIVTGPWAIQPAKLLEIQAIYATHLRGDKIDLEAVEKRQVRLGGNKVIFHRPQKKWWLEM